MKRRDFIKAAGVAAVAQSAIAQSAIAPATAQTRAPDSAEPLVGIQIAPVSLLDEGIERCLDTLREKASVNSLFIYSQTY